MDLKQLFTEDRGVSPVIGVILMVAITVILAAVIGAFVLGLGDQASQSAPQTSFNYDFNGDDDLDITHSGGDNIDNSTIEVRIGSLTVFDGAPVNADDVEELDSVDGWTEDTIRTGDTLEIRGDDEDFSGDTVRIIWTNPSGGSSNTLSDRTWP